jgi:heme exporter protein D
MTTSFFWIAFAVVVSLLYMILVATNRVVDYLTDIREELQRIESHAGYLAKRA